jgi:hypothetical protein
LFSLLIVLWGCSYKDGFIRCIDFDVEERLVNLGDIFMAELLDLEQKELLDKVASRLKLKSNCSVTKEQLEELTNLAGQPLPALFFAFQDTYGECENTDLVFKEDIVLFFSIEEMIDRIESEELQGKGVVPFAEDFFSNLWLLILKDKTSGKSIERVYLLAISERHQDSENPLELKADSFTEFIEELEVGSD